MWKGPFHEIEKIAGRGAGVALCCWLLIVLLVPSLALAGEAAPAHAPEGRMHVVITGSNYKGCDQKTREALDLIASGLETAGYAASSKINLVVTAGTQNYVAVVDFDAKRDVGETSKFIEQNLGIAALMSIGQARPTIVIYSGDKSVSADVTISTISKPDPFKLSFAVWAVVYPVAIGISSIVRYLAPGTPPSINMLVMTGILVPTMINLITPNLVSSLGGWIYPGAGKCSVPN